MYSISINHLRFISFIEGVSYLLLVLIGMPLKYGMGLLMVNKVLGMIHGMITIVFVIILFQIWKQRTLNFRWCLGVFVASLVPFAAFFAEFKLRIKQYSD